MLTKILLLLCALAVGSTSLSACNTIQGAGRDIEKAGSKLQDEAQEHIAAYGSNHTECILTAHHENAMRFTREVDASAVFVNASTRLNDGFEFGLGAEIGISTTRIHARGPMGLEELTSTKFIVLGNGQIRK